MGDYTISRRIGRGGMAEVFLALRAGLGGFEKLVVVKRIFKHFCEDEKFVQMFLDEARLAASIRHPNVVEIHDIDKDEHGYFIVMEYLSGENLAFVFEELRERDRAMPAHLVCRIGAEIAAGLHSAHISTDVEGRLQPIIHRDVTPSNLIVSFNGVVKIVDFGVAKAEVGNKQTMPGTLKGKVEYLAPEQIRNDPVDARTDVFQLGVVLHELFTGERLFRAKSDHEVMNAILDGPIPKPTDLRPELPAEIDEIVLGALVRRPEDRTRSADVLRQQLEQCMRHLGTQASQRSLGEWMKATFPDRFHERVKVERECVQQVRTGRASSEIPAVLAPFAPTAPVIYEAERATAATVVDRPQRAATVTPPPRRARTVGLVAVGGAAAVVLVGWWLRPEPDRPARAADPPRLASADLVDAGASAPRSDQPRLSVEPSGNAVVPESDTYRIVVRTIPLGATITFDDREVGAGRFEQEVARDGSTHRLVVRAPGYAPSSIVFRDAPPPETIELVPLQMPSAAKSRPDRTSVSPAADTGSPPGVHSTSPDARPSTGVTGPRTDGDDGTRRLPPTDNRNPWE